MTKKKTDMFAKIRSQMPSKQTVKYDTEILWTDDEGKEHGNVILHVKHACADNKQFMTKSLTVKNQLIKGNQEMIKRLGKSDDEMFDALQPEDLKVVEENNDATRKLYSETIVCGWDNVVMDGEPVPYTAEFGHDFLSNLDQSYMNKLVEFCGDESNFNVKSKTEVDAVVGN